MAEEVKLRAAGLIRARDRLTGIEEDVPNKQGIQRALGVINKLIGPIGVPGEATSTSLANVDIIGNVLQTTTAAGGIVTDFSALWSGLASPSFNNFTNGLDGVKSSIILGTSSVFPTEWGTVMQLKALVSGIYGIAISGDITFKASTVTINGNASLSMSAFLGFAVLSNGVPAGIIIQKPVGVSGANPVTFSISAVAGEELVNTGVIENDADADAVILGVPVIFMQVSAGAFATVPDEIALTNFSLKIVRISDI